MHIASCNVTSVVLVVPAALHTLAIISVCIFARKAQKSIIDHLPLLPLCRSKNTGFSSIYNDVWPDRVLSGMGCTGAW